MRVNPKSWCEMRVSSVIKSAVYGGIGILLCGASLAAELDEIHALIRQGHYGVAIEGLSAFLKTSPGDPQARFLLGVALAEDQQNEQAIAVFTDLTEDYPQLPEPYNNLAVLHASEGNYIKARDALLVAINAHPNYATAHENLGDIYAKMAGVAYDKALQLDGSNSAARAKLTLVDELFSPSAAAVEVAKLPSKSTAATTVVALSAVESTTMDTSSTGDQANARQQVLTILVEWAAAWSSQDAERYLSYYAQDFDPANGLDRDQWQASRFKRIAGPRFIDVKLSDAQVNFEGTGKAHVTFTQQYQSDTYQDVVRKEVLLSNDNKQWKIIRESSL